MDSQLNRQNLIRDISFFSSGTYISQILFFIRGFLNARILGPAMYGLWSGLNIILNYSAYVQLGSLNAMNREIPYQNGKSFSERSAKIRDVAFTMSLALNIIFSASLAAVTFICWKNFSLSESFGLITIAFLSLAVYIYEFYQTFLIAIKRFKLVSKANIIFSILSVILTLIFVTRFMIYGLYSVAVIIPILSFLYLWIKAPYRFKLDFDFHEMVMLMKIGLPMVTIDFLTNTIINISGIMVLLFMGREGMGYFSVALLAANFLAYFSNSVTRTFEPYVFQRYGQTQDIYDLRKYLFKPTIVMVFLFPVLISLYYTVAVFIIRHFLPTYAVCIYPFIIISAGRYLMSFSPTAISVITAINKQGFLVSVYAVGIVVLLLVSIICLKMGLGIIGVSLGLLLAFFFIGSVIFMYALSHYIKGVFKCLKYLAGSCSSLMYMVLALIASELIISPSPDFSSDLWGAVVRMMVILVFGMPLIYMADRKTGIIADVVGIARDNKGR